MSYLPSEIMEAILLLLPLESILLCKVVSKQWRNVINNSNFFNRYRGRPLCTFVNEGNLYCAIERHSDKITGNSFGHLSFSVRRIPIECNRSRMDKSVAMAPNGMVCVKGDQDHSFCLYNLFTGGSRIVKSAPVSDLSCICYGFGYDSVDDDYKILVVWKYDSYSFDSNPVFQSKDNDLFWVYSFSDDGWRRFKGFPYATFDWEPLRLEGKPACSVNNVLHWCIKTRDYKKVIATYDLHTCRFGKMVLPDGISYGILSELGGGQLCSSYFDENKIKVWGMKEYGVKESWTMLFSFDIYYYISSAAALCEWKDGRRLVLYDPPKNGSLHWYNIDTNEFRCVGRGIWRRSKVVNGGRGTTYRIMRVGNEARTWKEVVILRR